MKPFDLDELLSRVRNLLARHGRKSDRPVARSGESAVYSFGQAHINFDTYDVTVSGRKVRLTPLEMKLLRYFVEHQGRVIPREELLERVWEMPGHLYTRAPDQFIRRLRKTFEPDPAAPRHFLTLRDAGYRFVSQPAKNE
jgi:two-component system OmpR family response regulator